MVLPLLAGIGKQFLMSSAKDVAKKKILPGKKKIKSEKLFDKKDKGGALVKTEKQKTKVQSGGALVKYQDPKIQKDKLLNLKPESEDKTSVGEELQSVIDEVKKLRSGLVKIRGLLDERKNSELKSLVESKKQIQIDKKKKREGELESKKPQKKEGGIRLPKPKFSFFDSITNFFTSILIGSLLNFLLANKDKIFKAFEDISKGFTNIFDVMRFSIISLTTAMPGLVKTLAKLGKTIFKGPAKLTANLLKKLGGSIKNLLVNVGKSLSGFVSNTFKNLTGAGASGASGATRATGVQQRRFKGKGAKPKLRQLPKPGTPKPTSATTIKNAEKLFTKGGLKHFKRVSSVFKRVPFVGALIGIGIDLAMGERLDNAIAGAAGASLGAAIGGAIGTAAIPIPFVGTFLGGTIGAAVGDWAGKEIYKNLSGQITQINPPVTEEKPDTPSTSSPYSRFNQPMPGAPGTTGFVPEGANADWWSLVAISSLESSNQQGRADVAQSIYNRVASGKNFGQTANTVKGHILASGQYQPVREGDSRLFASISDKESAIAAVLSHPNVSSRTVAEKIINDTARALENPTLIKNAADWVGGRTDFAVPSAANKYPGGLGYKTRHGHLFGWYVGPGSIQYGRSNPGPAGKPNFPGISTGQAPPAPELPSAIPLTALIKQSQLPPLPPTNTIPGKQHYGAHRSGGRKHAGVDFDISGDEKFYSRIGGVVTKVANDPGGYGKYVDIYNETLKRTERIAEGARVLVKKGDVIRPGQAVVQGESETGVIHYEIRKGGGYGFSGTEDPTKFLASLDQKGGVSATTQSLRQQASYDQKGGTVVVPAPVIGGGEGPMIMGGNRGTVLPIGIMQKDVLNSYYRAQLMGFLYKQG